MQNNKKNCDSPRNFVNFAPKTGGITPISYPMLSKEDKTKEDKISVIVPVWNAARYLREALQSLRCQSYPNFEVILVNDGSADDSEEICREVCGQDSRFQLLNQANAGVSAARNAGIELAKGEWIAFMDADDIMMPDALETLWNAAKDTGAGIAVGSYRRGRDFKMPKKGSPVKMSTVDSAEAIKIGLYQKRILNNPWGVLFHSSVFKGTTPLRFRKCRYEDLDLFYQAFERVEKVCILDNVVYFYRDAPDSFINTWSDSRLDVLDVADRMVAHFSAKDASLLRAAEDRSFSAHFNMLLTMRKFGISNPRQKARCLNVIKSQRKAELSDPNVRLKNKLGALLSFLFV